MSQQNSPGPSTPTQGTVGPHIQRIQARESPTSVKLTELLDESNWTSWRDRIVLALRYYKLDTYLQGAPVRPDDPTEADNWDHNDDFTKLVIMNNIASSEVTHVGRCKTANEMWKSLELIHESKGHTTIIAVIRNLFHTIAAEGANISEHLTKMKQYWERINMIGDEDFRITDRFFKVIISSSLPLSWDAFTESYVGGRKGAVETDERKLMKSQEFIGILKEEYQRREDRTKQSESTSQVIQKSNLAKRIGNRSGQSTSRAAQNTPRAGDATQSCTHCGKNNHTTDNCIFLGKTKCSICGKFSHATKNCWSRPKKRTGDDASTSAGKKPKTEETHATVEDVTDVGAEEPKPKAAVQAAQKPAVQATQKAVEKTATATAKKTNEFIVYAMAENDKSVKFIEPEDIEKEIGGSGKSAAKGDVAENVLEDDEEIVTVYNSNGTNEMLLWYDWLADSATISHVANRREVF
jgi:gag-polypeptide of LTR copia-type